MYIVIEGIDGCGKTTLAKNLATLMNAEFRYEPDSTNEVTEALRTMCLNKDYNNILTPMAREYMMLANRAISTAEVNQLVQDGKTVVQDRSFISGMVYANVASQIPFNDWWLIGESAIRILPHLFVYVTTDKQKIDKVDGDIYDHAKEDFHSRIAETFPKALEFVNTRVCRETRMIEFKNDFTKTPEENAKNLLNIINDLKGL